VPLHVLFFMPDDHRDLRSPGISQTKNDIIAYRPVTEGQEDLRKTETHCPHPSAFTRSQNNTFHVFSAPMAKICLDFQTPFVIL
jgi:hypothetical protein